MQRLRGLARSTSVRAAGELSLLALWTVWVGRAFLDSHPDTWPIGGDFALTLEPYYAWRLLPRCGACFLWNGGINGGYPAFAELHGAFLHPLVAVPVLAFGVLYGSKLSFVLSLFLAGAAQWWLARVMRLSAVPRVWVGAMAIAGGHLAGRMQFGLSALVLSAASAGLVLAAVVDLAEHGRRRTAILLAVAVALTLVSGQGYVQVGMVLGIAPAALILVAQRGVRLGRSWKEFALAGLLAIVLAGVFLVPLAHFAPFIDKHTDPDLAAAEPLEYVPLNLVIHDEDYYAGEYARRLVLPAMYMNYVGWIPVGLGAVAVCRARKERRRVHAFLMVCLALVFFLGSEAFLRLLAAVAPGFAAGYRYPSLVTVLAGSLVLALAASGLEEVLQKGLAVLRGHPRVARHLGHSLAYTPLVVLGLFALHSIYTFSQEWLQTVTLPPVMRQVAQALRAEGTAWVSPPVGHPWAAYMLEAGNKVTQVYRPWRWRDRVEPPASLIATRSTDLPSGTEVVLTFGDEAVVVDRRYPYAQIETPAGAVVCDAAAQGGDIHIECETPEAGMLTLRENAFVGWSAWRDGERIPLEPSAWLRVQAPAGEHVFEFRYRPWDVFLGAALSLAGMIAAGWLWIAAGRSASGARPPAGGEPAPGLG